MQHYAPHPTARFEGYYSKFALPSGAHLALIICSVPGATTLPPHLLSVTYVPASQSPSPSRTPATSTSPSSQQHRIWQRELAVPEIQRITLSSTSHAFEIRIPGFGSMTCDGEGMTTWEIKCPKFELHARTTSLVPWDAGSRDGGTPEGWLVNLPLPLHWHVHSLGSDCEFRLRISGAESLEKDIHEKFDAGDGIERTRHEDRKRNTRTQFVLPAADHKGRCTVHQEKNWANSFPESHIWIQALYSTSSSSSSSPSSLTLAGGSILHLNAFLIGYCSPSLNISIAPPWSLSLPLPHILTSYFPTSVSTFLSSLLSPFLQTTINYPSRTFSLRASNWRHRIDIQAQAPRDTFFGLSASFREGHRGDFCTESFCARVVVRVEERVWGWGGEGEGCGWGWARLWRWKEVRREVFEGASLEFGGGVYGDRGLKGKRD